MNKQLHINSPLIEALSIGKKLKARVWLKMESSQPSGSFKIRGIGYAFNKFIQDGAKEFIIASGGNAGYAAAYAGRKLKVPVSVVVPETTKKIAKDLIKSEGAKVIVSGKSWDESHSFALSHTSSSLKYIHPFDDPLLWEGHSTIIDEIYHAGLKPDMVVLSVGGGGLLCGIAEGLRKNNFFKTKILAVETHGADSFFRAKKMKKLVTLDKISSIATSLGAKTVAKKAFDLTKDKSVISHLISDHDALEATDLFLKDHRTLVEPACGASLSPVYKNSNIFEGFKNILIIVCGGVGFSIDQLNEWKNSNQ